MAKRSVEQNGHPNGSVLNPLVKMSKSFDRALVPNSFGSLDAARTKTFRAAKRAVYNRQPSNTISIKERVVSAIAPARDNIHLFLDCPSARSLYKQNSTFKDSTGFR